MLKKEKLWPGSYTISWTFWSLFLKRSFRNPSEWPQISFWPTLKKKNIIYIRSKILTQLKHLKLGQLCQDLFSGDFYPVFFYPLEVLVSLGKSKKRLNESLEEADGIISVVCKTRSTPFSLRLSVTIVTLCHVTLRYVSLRILLTIAVVWLCESLMSWLCSRELRKPLFLSCYVRVSWYELIDL